MRSSASRAAASRRIVSYSSENFLARIRSRAATRAASSVRRSDSAILTLAASSSVASASTRSVRRPFSKTAEPTSSRSR